MNQNILEVLIKNAISKIIEAGFEDPTNMRVSLTSSGKNIKFQLYTEEKWEAHLASLSDAEKLATKLGFGEKPDHVVVHENVVYYIKII